MNNKMSSRESGIDLAFDIELSLDDFDRILEQGSDSNGYYTLKSKPPLPT